MVSNGKFWMFAFLFLVVVSVQGVSATLTDLDVNTCTQQTGTCSPSDLNTDDTTTGMTVDKNENGQVDTWTNLPGDVSSIDTVNFTIRHNGDNGIDGAWTLSFTNEANTVTYCEFTNINHVQSDTTNYIHDMSSCSWTETRLNDLRLNLFNGDGKSPSTAYVTYLEMNVTYTPTNSPPTVDNNVSDSPDPVTVNSNITYSVNATDPEGDNYRLTVCKSDSINDGYPGECANAGLDNLCDSSATSSGSEASCQYNTTRQDAPSLTGYGFVCDAGGNTCTSADQTSTTVERAYGVLNVTISSPPNETTYAQNYIFDLNATVSCESSNPEAECGSVLSTARYNGTSGITVDTKIPSVSGDPLHTPADGSSWNSSWKDDVTLTMDSSKIQSSLTDFPMLIETGVLPQAVCDNLNSDASDVRITTNDSSTVLPREVVFFNQSTCDGEIYVKVNTSMGAIKFHYGNPSASDPLNTSPGGRNAVWSSYTAVYHFSDDPAQGTLTDATGNGNDMTVDTTNGAAMESSDLVKGNKSGRAVGQSWRFNGSQWLLDANLQFASTVTIHGWVFDPDFDSAEPYWTLADSTNSNGMISFKRQNADRVFFDWQFSQTGLGHLPYVLSSTNPVEHYAGLNTDGSTHDLYINGSGVNSTSQSVTLDPGFFIGARRVADGTITGDSSRPGQALEADLNEVRFLNGSQLSDAWQNTTYMIEGDNPSFWTVESAGSRADCGVLNTSDSCSVSFDVNASGEVGTNWFVDVLFNSTTYPTNVSSNNTEDRLISIGSPYGVLNVSWLYPTSDLSVIQNNLFDFNVSVTCVGVIGSECGTVESSARYNGSSSVPDTLINTSVDTPFYIGAGGSSKELTSTNTTDTFEVTEVEFYGSGITFNGSFFWVLTDIVASDSTVEKYDLSGNFIESIDIPDSSAEMNGLSRKNDSSEFYYTRTEEDVLIKTDNSFNQISNFSLDSENSDSAGVYFNGTHFFVLNSGPDKVFIYNESGTLIRNFSVSTTSPRSIGGGREYNRLFIGGTSPNSIFEYRLNGSYTGFNWTANSTNSPQGISFNETHFYIVAGVVDSDVEKQSTTFSIVSNPQTCGTISQGEKCNVSWIVNATGSIGSSWFVDALFNSTTYADNITQNDTVDRKINIISPYGVLNVSWLYPTSDLTVSKDTSFDINASVMCDGLSIQTCGNVEATARYNGSSASPDTAINTSVDTPFYISGGGGSSVTKYDYKGVTNPGSSLVAYDGRLEITGDRELENTLTITNQQEGTSTNYGEINESDDVDWSHDYVEATHLPVIKLNISINESADSVSEILVHSEGYGLDGTVQATDEYSLHAWNGTGWVLLETTGTISSDTVIEFIINESSTPSLSEVLDGQRVYFVVAGSEGDLTTGNVELDYFYINVTASGVTNPQVCGTINQGESCNVSWSINASGSSSSAYLIDVLFNSTTYPNDVTQNDTVDYEVCIDNCPGAGDVGLNVSLGTNISLIRFIPFFGTGSTAFDVDPVNQTSTNALFVVNNNGSASGDVQISKSYSSYINHTSSELSNFSVGSEEIDITGIEYNGSHYYFVGYDTATVYEYDSSGSYTGFNFSVSNEVPTPGGIYLYNQTSFYVTGNNASNDAVVFEYDRNGNPTGFNFTGPYYNANGVTYNGSHFYIIERSSNYVREHNSSGGYLRAFFSVNTQAPSPSDIEFIDNKYFYITNTGGGATYVYDSSGNFLHQVGIPFTSSASEAMTIYGREFFIGERINDFVHKFNFTSVVETFCSTSGTFSSNVVRVDSEFNNTIISSLGAGSTQDVWCRRNYSDLVHDNSNIIFSTS